ncbi:hypothetical protein CDAR_266721 [Caerostris darwini]|uniref:Uncharacterized protein n=1 Tax=Caerostris darwini TaxID=1538125 RepID=A0AAV4QLH9_9ARAC|nr:hypothetical protein CDAR_266721 [Caerostris darwini]
MQSEISRFYCFSEAETFCVCPFQLSWHILGNRCVSQFRRIMGTHYPIAELRCLRFTFAAASGSNKRQKALTAAEKVRWHGTAFLFFFQDPDPNVGLWVNIVIVYVRFTQR